MRALCLLMSVVALPAACGGGQETDGRPAAGQGVALRVMTRNLYLGSDLLPVVMAPTVAQIPIRVSELWKNVLDSQPEARLVALAEEIADQQPDVVGLQEVALFRFQERSNFAFAAPALDATAIRFDFLKVLQDALAARGAVYQEPIVLENADVELPGGSEAERFDIRMTDRDAVLVREGLIIHGRSALQYPSKLTIPLPVFDTTGASMVKATLVRGVTMVDLEKDGARFTFANTHLEVDGGPSGAPGPGSPEAILAKLQEDQATDLVRMLDARKGPVVAVGDYNSPADGSGTRSYGIISAKLKDAWKSVPGAGTGLTCCSSLGTEAFETRSRIDLVFTRGAVAVDAGQVVGTDRTKRTATGLWPSDHAGVVMSLRVAR